MDTKNDLAAEMLISSAFSKTTTTKAYPSVLPFQIEELIEVFKHRAEKINSDLNKFISYAEINSFLEKFNKLHLKHIEALQKTQLVFANFLLDEVKELSKELQAIEDEINPNKSVFDAKLPFFYFKNKDLGPIINIYISSRNSLDYYCVNFLNKEDKKEEEVTDFYLRILGDN